MKYLVLVSVVLIVYFGQAILYQFGWVIDFGGAPTYQKIYPAFYLLSITSGYAILVSYKNIRDYISELSLLFLCVLAILVMLAHGENGGFSLIINNLIIPILLSITIVFFDKKYVTIRKSIRKLLIYFFVINCLMAIFERLLQINLFLYYNGEGSMLIPWLWDIESFRSTSLHNHPLSNALVVSIMIFFIMYSDFSQKKKHVLFFLGLVALLCFNTRFAIAISVLYYSIYFLLEVMLSRNVKAFNKIGLILIMLVALVGILILMFRFDFGARIFKHGMFDEESAGARLEILHVFQNYDMKKFLIGGPSIDLINATKQTGLDHIENYWIFYLFKVGFVLTLAITFTYAFILRKYSLAFGKYHILITLFFLMISSSNNSLASGVPGISFFILSAYAFSNSFRDRINYLKGSQTISI